MNTNKTVVMVASENDALIGGKVGGVGDVVRNLPRALASLGWECIVLTPSYGFLHRRNPASLISEVTFPFYGERSQATVWRVDAKQPCEGVTNYVVDHGDIKGEPIYYDDPPESPFMRDATKYAMFCSAVGQYLAVIGKPAVLHLHDWHAATLLMLRDIHPLFPHLKNIRTVFTIHNIAIQGTRPMRGHASSVEAWFPELLTKPHSLDRWADNRYVEPCYTPMQVGTKFAEAVNTVSPTYAEEILRPSDHTLGYYGGEGLESSLRIAKEDRRLFGILNGCDYPEVPPASPMPFTGLCDLLASEVQSMKKFEFGDAVLARIRELRNLTPACSLTGVMRVVEQKVRLIFERLDNHLTVDRLMEIVSQHNGVCLILGSGAAEYERGFMERMQRHPRLLFIKGYSDRIANALYASGTLFLMPSSFEPCGISQMIAMREGQPCIVHAVGGLKDTVRHGVNGFTFSGDTLVAQATGFVGAVELALNTFARKPAEWKNIVTEARNARFTWEESARQYEKMYNNTGNI